MFAPDFFLPKDKDLQLFIIAHELYHRLRDRADQLDCVADSRLPDGFYRGYDQAINDEIEFLKNIIDCIERS